MSRPATGLLIVLLAGCGIGSSDSVEEFTAQELAELSQISPTTTTTDTSILGNDPPPTGSASDTGDVTAGDTGSTDRVRETPRPTSAAAATDDVELYFIDGSRLVPIEITLVSPVSPRQRLEALASGPDADDAEAGIRTAVPPDLVKGLRISGGEVTVDLDVAVLNTVESPDQLQMVAQIVLTLTGPMGFDAVRFTVGEQPAIVFRGDNSLSEAGESMARDDYDELLADRSSASQSPSTATSLP